MEILCLNSNINAISISPDKKLAVCGGRGILKLIGIEGPLQELRSLRSGKHKLLYSTQDLAWHPILSNYILTASKTSTVVLWNLEKDSRKEQVFNGHTKVVNRVNWHPQNTDVFISAGQDDVIKVWDIRTGCCTATVEGNAEGARDVSFSPSREFTFAGCFDNGAIQIWDLRRMDEIEGRFTAHARNALSINWHPSMAGILASGGGDRAIKVWNTQSNENLKKIQAPEPVFRVSWDVGSHKQLASISHMHDNNMYIWHYDDSHLPTYVFKGHKDPVTDFLLFDDSVITCSGKGTIIRQSRDNAYRPGEFLSPVHVAISPLNIVALSHSKHDHEAKRTQLKFRSLGDFRDDIQRNARDYRIEGENIKTSCSINNSVSTKHSGLWKSIETLYNLKQKTEQNWVRSIVEESLQETIEYYAELGDIQTSACIASVLNLNGPIKEYETLLRQLGLHISAAKLKLATREIEIFTKCKCGKDSEEHNDAKCSGMALCAFCGMTVKGLYSWCQGCGHGGHLVHMQHWFTNSVFCPKGCGHQCISN